MNELTAKTRVIYWIETADEDYFCGDYESLDEAKEQAEAMKDNGTWYEFGECHIVEQDTQTGETTNIYV